MKVFLVSGGLDSYIAWSLYKDENSTALFVDYGHQYAHAEITACRKLYEDIAIISLKGAPPVTLAKDYIPNRNLLLATVAATYFHPDEIVIAGLGSDNCLDKNETAFKEYSKMLSKFSKKQIVVTSPFWQYDKLQIVELYLSKGLSKEKLDQTYSCYSGTTPACGHCNACLRKKRFFDNV